MALMMLPQIDGTVAEINNIDPPADRFKSFGYFVQSVNGHDFNAMSAAIDAAKKHTSGPSLIILNTIKGKDVPFAENQIGSHFMPVTKENLDCALAALGEKGGA